ncbi:MAG: PfkB domain protein [Nocardioidaceae bacterium]|nr:PfkB domain protein [Nocardioidaceae bacterium]
MDLTTSEEQILRLLRVDPLLGSEAIAQRLGTTRAAVNVHLSNLGKKGVILGRGYVLDEDPAVVVIGGANMDIKARSRASAVPGSSNPGTALISPGGVGRNVAENLARLGTRTHLVASVGSDDLGEQLLSATQAAGVHVEHVRRGAKATGTYTAIVDADGEMIVAVADMTATDDLPPVQLDRARDVLATASFLILDGNLSTETLSYALDLAQQYGVRVLLDPVSVPKAGVLSPVIRTDRPIHTVTPNRGELAALTGLPTKSSRQVAKASEVLHARGVEWVWVRLGERGSILSGHGEQQRIESVPTAVADVTGAGDAMSAAYCHELLRDRTPLEAATFAHAAAALTIASEHTVRPDLTDHLVRRITR